MKDIVGAAGLEKESIYGYFSAKKSWRLKPSILPGPTMRKRMGNLGTVNDAMPGWRDNLSILVCGV